MYFKINELIKHKMQSYTNKIFNLIRQERIMYNSVNVLLLCTYKNFLIIIYANLVCQDACDTSMQAKYNKLKAINIRN